MAPDPTRWSLEVVRGRKPGQVFPLPGGEILLGNAPAPPTHGIDLAGQESSTTRRMEPQHAALNVAGPVGATIRDLDSEAGTFVNRRRVLPGQRHPLHHGDEIQLGAVVLRFARVGESGTNTRTETFAYVFDDGPTCRTWDELVVVSSQRWASLSADLASGRVDQFVQGIGRGDLRPRSALGSTADDRLDAWLSSLPTTRPFPPELEVHPARVVLAVSAGGGGGTVARTVQVQNTGHRLLRCAVRVEPADLTWLRLAPAFEDQPITAVESARVDFEVVLPETVVDPLVGRLVISGNGGTRTVEVVVEPRDPADPDDAPAASPPPPPLSGWIARASARRVIASGAVGLGLLRLGVALGGPGLGGVAALFAAVGALLGGVLATRRGGLREAAPGGFAAGCAGALVAAVAVAATRTVEPAALSQGVGRGLVAALGWAAVGAGVGALVRRSARRNLP